MGSSDCIALESSNSKTPGKYFYLLHSFSMWDLKFDIVFQELCMLTIRILGTGCPSCDNLHQEVINALAELNIAADVRHERNPAEFYRFGVAATRRWLSTGR